MAPMSEEKKLALKAKKYGLTIAQLTALLNIKACQICGRAPQPGKKLYIDHDHKTQRVRGVLCFTDNYRLLGRGNLGKAEIHYKAAIYLSSTFDWRNAQV